MEIRFYRPATMEEPVITPVGITTEAFSVRYSEKFYSFGEFEFSISCSAYGAENIRKYLYVLIDRKYWGLILELERVFDGDADNIKAYGLSLDGLTMIRVTVPPNFSHEEVGGVAGYDAVNGSTETCMKHYIARNLLDIDNLSPTRKIPNFIIAPDLGRGNPEDKYMTRFEWLDEVLEDLGRTAKVGYRITPDLMSGNLIFDCMTGTDKTHEQSANSRILFAPERGNVKRMSWLDSDRSMRNVFYASLSGSKFVDDTYTATITRDDILPEGIFRREQYMEISATHPEPGRELEELERLGLARAESYETETALEADITDDFVYGEDFELGDFVTVQNRDWGLSMNPQITEVEVDGGSSGMTTKVTFGRAIIRAIGRLERRIRGG